MEVGGSSIRSLTEQCVFSSVQLMFCVCSLSVPPGSLESIPRHDLEQRLRSSMIMVEALVQQLSAARAQGAPAAAAPSNLREKLVQTDHTELSQVRTKNECRTSPLSKCIVFLMQLNFLRVAISHMNDISRQSLMDGLCRDCF